MLCLQSLEEEEKMTPEQLAIKNVGKQVHWSSGFISGISVGIYAVTYMAGCTFSALTLLVGIRHVKN